MSDDEEYFEWEEEYIFEDVPDIVDDVAVTSYYETALYDDPAVDMEEFFSDWDYYSDDYYDDDPTAERGTVTVRAGNGKIDARQPTRKTETATRQPQRRGPRARSVLKPDATSFQGVVWKTPSLERDQDVAVQIYEPGHGEKVALLENWREVFKSAQPALDKSRLRNKRRVRESRRSRASSSPQADAMQSDNNEDDDDQGQDSSSQMSDDISVLERLREKDADADAGDGSNTTPELGQSPYNAPAAPAPAKRGRKRKAEAAVEDEKTNGPSEDSARLRSKRVASRKGDGKEIASQTSSGPVRRSARARK